MNKQEIFTKVKNHLLTQNQKSTFDGGCAYRGSNGLMCAVGCLIPDELYYPGVEGNSVSYLPTNVQEFLGGQNLYLLDDLQYVHDRVDVEQWETKLREVATRYNLEF